MGWKLQWMISSLQTDLFFLKCHKLPEKAICLILLEIKTNLGFRLWILIFDPGNIVWTLILIIVWFLWSEVWAWLWDHNPNPKLSTDLRYSLALDSSLMSLMLSGVHICSPYCCLGQGWGSIIDHLSFTYDASGLNPHLPLQQIPPTKNDSSNNDEEAHWQPLCGTKRKENQRALKKNKKGP